MIALLREQRVLCAATLLMLLAGSLGWRFVWHSIDERSSAQHRLHSEIERLNHYLRHAPALTSKSLDAAQYHRAALREQRASLRRSLGIAAASDSGFTGSPEDLYFEVITLVDRLRDEAFQAGVDVSESAGAFGFADILETGDVPPPAMLDALYGQMGRIDWLMLRLFEAKPIELIRVHRNAKEGIPKQTRSPGDRIASNRRGPTAIEVTFAAHTKSLRQWLQAIVDSRLPLSIRALSARPERESDRRGGTDPKHPFALFATESASARQGPIPIVRSRPSIFKVTIEPVEPPGPAIPHPGPRHAP